jgi:8-oxo-dGTP pyrophosphatase MutT (NUDIX family)
LIFHTGRLRHGSGIVQRATMPTRKRDSTSPAKPKLPVRTQRSAGGVAFRRIGGKAEVVIVRVGTPGRWQLPKGIVDEGESPEAAAIRETREEGGVDAELVAPLETIEYWYVGDASTGSGQADRERVRFHKFVHFFLLEHRSGDPSDHDWEVAEARWASLDEAIGLLAFRSERQVLERARELLV